MKHIKTYKIFESNSPKFPTTREEVMQVCEKYHITRYTINDDLSIDVGSYVYLDKKGLKYLPLKFNYVSGNFDCSHNKLKTLEGCPQTVGGIFDCEFNKLVSLEGCPQTIEGNFNCSHNELQSLEGCPQTIEGNFNCGHNGLTSLEGCPQTVTGGFGCSSNELTTLEGCPQTAGKYFDCSYNKKLKSLNGSPQKVEGDFNCSGNNLKTLESGPQTVGGNFNCSFNKLKDLEHISEVNGTIYIYRNPVHLLLNTFINKADTFMIEDFIDYEIVRNRDTVMLDRLQTFIRDNDLEMPNLEDIKERYKIIE